ncbi:membrane protein DedA with SNARE-associated domain [Actinomycetospora corticicola]|uniref:Membrane protein DedA with SNARE-associated domain n=1 Tax=Actinomycetospora corticicola TaxID=663602 RepID=A0A7Y9DTS9_9PSEU|nr:membrane protein DedA with SNARE-associated domain [Actinomycetospora corticicola]
MQAPASDGGLAGWATDLMASFGAPGAGLIVAIENVFPPIPSEIILPLAGFAAGRGEFSVWAAIIWTTAGSVVGAVALYLVGMLCSDGWVRRTIARMPLVSEDDVAKAEAWFDRHGRASVFWGRMIPGVRSFVSIPAGQRRMPWWEFTAFTALGSLIWNSVFVGGGYALGSQWQLVEQYAGVFQTVVLVLLVALVVFMLVKRYRRHRAVKKMEAPTQVLRVPDDEA